MSGLPISKAMDTVTAIPEKPKDRNQLLFDEFLNYLSVEKGLARNTLDAYRRDLAHYGAFLKKEKIADWHRVLRPHILKFLASERGRKLEESSVARGLVTVKLFHRFLNKEYKIPRRDKRSGFSETLEEAAAVSDRAGNECDPENTGHENAGRHPRPCAPRMPLRDRHAGLGGDDAYGSQRLPRQRFHQVLWQRGQGADRSARADGDRDLPGLSRQGAREGQNEERTIFSSAGTARGSLASMSGR